MHAHTSFFGNFPELAPARFGGLEDAGVRWVPKDEADLRFFSIGSGVPDGASRASEVTYD